MFIKYNPQHPHIKVVPVVSGGASVAAGSVTLSPGTNEISEKDWEAIKPHLAAEIADGTITAFSVKTAAGGTANAKTLKDVPVSTATKIIAECSNKETLRAWFNGNLPDELALLVIKRMRQLNMDVDEIAAEADGGNQPLGDSEITVESGDSGTPPANDGGSSGKTPPKGRNGGGKTPPAKPATPAESATPTEPDKPDENAGESGGDETPKFDAPDAKVD